MCVSCEHSLVCTPPRRAQETCYHRRPCARAEGAAESHLPLAVLVTIALARAVLVAPPVVAVPLTLAVAAAVAVVVPPWPRQRAQKVASEMVRRRARPLCTVREPTPRVGGARGGAHAGRRSASGRRNHRGAAGPARDRAQSRGPGRGRAGRSPAGGAACGGVA
eukprot:306410-Prymnesium_polylepis.1